MAEFNGEDFDIFAGAPDGIVVVDEGGRITAANEQLAQMFGYDAADLVGETIELLIPERFREGHVSQRKSYTSHPTRRPMGLALALFGRRSDGDEFPVEISLNHRRTDNGRMLVVAFVRDVTEQHRLAEELRATEESFRLLVEGVEDHAIYRLDPAGNVVTWNQGAERIKGWAPQDVIGRHFSLFYVPEDVSSGLPERHLEQAAASGRLQNEGWRQRASGQRFWAETTLSALRDETGTLRGFAKVTRDRTEARHARARLESIAALNRAVLENRPDEELLDIAVRRACAMLNVGTVALWTPAGNEFRVTHADGSRADGVVGSTAPHDSIVGVVARANQARVSHQVAADLGVTGFSSAAFVPISANGELFGVIGALTSESREVVESHDVDLLQSFGMQAAVSIAHARSRAEADQLHLVSERERIARDLHDTVIQRLFAVGLSLEATSRRPSTEMQERLHQAVSDIDDTIRSIRSSIFELETRAELVSGLRSRVLEVIAQAATALGFEPTITFDGPVDTLTNPELTDNIAAVVREALSNVARHAAATSAAVAVTATPEELTVTITDNGRGSGDYARTGGHGMSNVQERARLLRGDASVTAIEPHGTRVEWHAPVRD